MDTIKYNVCFYDDKDVLLYETYVLTNEWYLTAITVAGQRYSAQYPQQLIQPIKITCRETSDK